MNNKPLATRMRPTTLKEVVGQEHLLGEGKILERMVKTKRIDSIILYGKPGIGKTSIAHALSNDFNLKFKYFNAGVHAKKDLTDLVKGTSPENPVIVLLDEVHRLDKPKQDFLLMHIEEGNLIMVGATTENPYMSINPALRSRTTILELSEVSKEAIVKVLKRTLRDKEKGLGDLEIIIDDETLSYIANQANGDVRVALNTLELASLSTDKESDGKVHINKNIVNICLQKKQIGGDKDGDSHYNILSAFQKSIRGSDADASLHYLARLIVNGDLESILRRLLVISFEDIGLANTSIHAEVVSSINACRMVGLPEARIILGYIVIRLALSEKSNVAYRAIDLASEELHSDKNLEIPKFLHDTHYKGASSLGKGVGYNYPHNSPQGLNNQNHLPKDFENDRYLQFRDNFDTSKFQKVYKNISNLKKSNN